jgi:hypothetical protein
MAGSGRSSSNYSSLTSLAISLLLDSLEPSFALSTKLAHPVSGAGLGFRVVFIFPNWFRELQQFEQASPPIAVILFFHALPFTILAETDSVPAPGRS